MLPTIVGKPSDITLVEAMTPRSYSGTSDLVHGDHVTHPDPFGCRRRVVVVLTMVSLIVVFVGVFVFIVIVC